MTVELEMLVDAALELLAGGGTLEDAGGGTLEDAGELAAPAAEEEPATGVEPTAEHPDLATSSAGHATVSKSTVGLLAPPIQSQRKSQPGWSALGNWLQVLVEEPPYWAPQTAEEAFHSVVQAS